MVSLATLASVARDVSAQEPRVLHRPIPGDLPLDGVARRLPPPVSSADVRTAAGASSTWRDRQPVSDQIARPRASWEAPVRELDRQTRSPDGTRLRYEEVFTPAVAPFKRLQAYDAVDELGRLTVRDPALRPLRVGDQHLWGAERRSRFVGELLVEVSPDWPTPIPGVAGEQQVVSYSTSTGDALEFANDSAGNLFVRGTRPGTIRLSYVLEAPEHAFVAGDVPNLPIAAAAAEVPTAQRPLVPTWLPASADTVLRRAVVSRSDPLDQALGRLVGYFRAFRDAELTDARGVEIYSDLALGGVGACRHRAYALVPTLHALGIPARYVGNEAHAWAEVFVTRVGWTRIDLGGWDVPLDATAPTDRPAFRPSNRDPFPQPSQYRSGYSYMNSGSGSVASGPDGGAPVADPSAAGGDAGGPGVPGSIGARADGDGGVSIDPNGGTSAGALPSDRNPGSIGASASGGSLAASRRGEPSSGSRTGVDRDDDRDVRVPITLEVREIRGDESAGFATAHGFVRGSMVRVSGDVTDEQHHGVGNLVIQVEIARDRQPPLRLGTTVSRSDGGWDARVLLPDVLDPGGYEIRASTPGDARHFAASGE